MEENDSDDSGILISGGAFRGIRDERFWTQSEMATRLGIGLSGVQRIERFEAVRVKKKTFRKLAEVLNITLTQLLERIRAEKATPELLEDLNVDPYSETQFHEIPLFDLGLAAGGWCQIDGEGEICDSHSMKQGLFRVRLRGDSMERQYRDGDIIEFRCIRVDKDGFSAGKDYYIQRDDGTATFKRVQTIEEEVIVLAALNKKKYPKPMKIERSLVVRAAIALNKIQPLD